MSAYTLLSLAALATASDFSPLFARNNPPQPPCTYPYTNFVYSGCFQDSVSSRSLPFMTQMEFNNATVEQCTAYCKGNNYRYAGLEYYGQCFCGASVSSTSAPETDCNLPCNGDKTEACGGQNRISIYQDPTFPDADDIAISSDYKALGCYTEGTSGRSLDYSQWDFLNADNMTTETCLDACGAKGYPFAGTEFGRECYCGVVLGNGTEPADASECSSQCTGNSTQICGGPNRLSLYVAKTLESTEPCGPPVLSSSSVSSSTTTPPPSSSTSTSTPVSTTSTTKSTSTSKCVGWWCPKTSCKTPTPTPPKSTTPCKASSTKKVSSTFKTSTTPCKISTVKSKAKSSPTPCATKKNPWDNPWGW